MSELALDLFNAISEIVKLRKRIAELEGKIDQLIEAGELLAEYCEYETGKIAWDALVKDWKEGEKNG